MKVLMQGRYELLTKGGGDKVQVENTAEELRKLGVEVDIVGGDIQDYSKYDLIHLFQLDWTPETYFLALSAKAHNKPLILSPIHHSVKEVKRFDDFYVFDFRRISKILFKEQHNRDTFKNFYRCIFNPKKLKPTLKSVFIGLKNMHRRTLSMADYVLVQTTLEAKDLLDTYEVDFKWKKVLNGVGENFSGPHTFANKLGIHDYIICVGRIEPRKNQLKVIEAVKNFRQKNNLDLKLVLIGSKCGERHFEYKYLFNKALRKNPWIIHIDSVPYKDMPSYYRYAKVGVSASWFETTGLTSLEALYCGANAVASGDRAREYLDDLVTYCDPASVESIEDAIKKEYYAPKKNLPETLHDEYTWKNAATKTLEVYNEVLNSR